MHIVSSLYRVFNGRMKKIISLLFICLSFSLIAKSQKVLIVVTSHETLGKTGKKTGYYLSEVSHPYHELVAGGFTVDFASPRGGHAPMDPKSLDLKDKYNKKFYEDKKVFERLKNTVKLSEVKTSDYAAVLFAGGHGTMWDFPDSKDLQRVVTEIYENRGVVASVCHGPAALVNVKLSNGTYLIKGKRVTGFTNKEEDIVELTQTMPFLLEDKLKERGASFLGSKPWSENVVVDGRIVTGQNPASASKLGKEVVKLLKK